MDFEDRSLTLPIIPVHLPAILIRMCLLKGYPQEALLSGTNIHLDDLDNTDTYFTLNQTGAIVQNALKIMSDPTISIAFSQHVRLSHLGSFGIALMSVCTIRDALDLCVNYLYLLDPTYDLKIKISQNQVSLFFGKNIPLGLSYNYTQEAMCLSIVRILTDLFEKSLPQIKIDMNYSKPTYAEKFNFLNIPISWGKNKCAVHFNSSILDVRLPSADFPAFQKAIKMCEAEKKLVLSQGEHWLVKLKLLILQNLHQPLTAQEAAERLYLSRRTFFRKLSEHETTYEELLSSARAEVARDYLLYKKTNLVEVAFLVGYHDVSNFTKAFKRWYGLPPKQWLQSQVDSNLQH
jgi:AraC-like DNA-binding protein